MATTSLNDKLLEFIFKLSRFKEHMAFSSDLTQLTMHQIQALVFLQKHENAQMREIAEHFKIELPSATSLINKLVSVNLVERKADEHDRRLVRIVLTQHGKDLFEQVKKDRSKKIEQMLSYLSEEDKHELLRIMEKLVAKMEEMYHNDR